MIHRTAAAWQTPDWQRSMANAFTSVDELLAFLELNRDQLQQLPVSPDRFGLKVPREFAALIAKRDSSDPILKQILPLEIESQPQSGYSRDPVGDLDTQVARGVLQKYHGRQLLLATGACAIHCRYCFRRHYPYSSSTANSAHWLAHLSSAEGVDEVILSGGDPLTLTDQRLQQLVEKLAHLPQLKRLRIHTRLPVVIPSRITPELRNWLTGSRLQPVLVLHINHANEISPALKLGLEKLRLEGVTLLNQSVLLRGVNDSVQTLKTLSEALFDAGILPYYLHMLDRVQGAAHFDLAESRARSLLQALREKLPGYLVPKLVREHPQEGSKRLLA